MIQVFGVDPGLVHTGIISMIFSGHGFIGYTPAVVNGCDPWDITGQVAKLIEPEHKTHVFVEDYRPRSNLNTDRRMTEAVSQLKQTMTASVFLDNMGVKKVVREDLMKVLGIWNFGPSTHHQDIRSAARIALLGMMKDDVLNDVLYRAVSNELAPF